MKKIFLLLFFVVNITPQYYNGAIHIESVQKVFAQYIDCPTRADCVERANFWRWLGSLFQAIGEVTGNFINMLGMALDGGGGGGEGFASTPDPAAIWALLNTSSVAYGTPNAPVYGPGGSIAALDPGWQISVSTLIYSPDAQDCAGVYGGSSFLDDCGNCVGGTTGLLPCYVPRDCAGVLNGRARIDSCGKCVLGITGLLPCTKDCAGAWGGIAGPDGCDTCAGGTSGIARCDTVKPLKVICDSPAIANGNSLTNVLDSAALESAYIQQLKDSALNSPNEAGISITKISFRRGTTYGTFNFQGGNDNSVEIETYDSIRNIIAGIHTHPAGRANTPSPGDLYHLIEGNMGNKNYFADYVFAYDDSAQMAIMITDTALAHTFFNAHPKDSTVQGAPVNDWSNSTKNSATKQTLYQDYFKIMVGMFNNEHYPLSMIQTYANVRVFGELNTGVKVFIKQDGQFKQLSYETSIDATGIEHTKIKICQ